MLRVGLAVVFCGVVLVACDKTPPPPDVEPSPPLTINGTERLGWNQSAADAVELSTFRYAIYVDGSRSELSGASCARGPSAQIFSCSAKLPSLSAGNHTLELAALVVDGATLESARSAPLQVNVVAAAAQSAQARRSPAAAWPSGRTVVTSDGVRLRLEQLPGDVIEPTDFAFVPDGRLFVAERAGRIRVVHEGRLAAEPAAPLPDSGAADEQLLALAVDPRFDRTHFVYAIYATRSRSGLRAFSLARFREVSDTLVDRIIVLDEIAATSSAPAATLRFGPDGKLFAGFDAGAAEGLAGDLASANGKILRLNPDGTTPDDQPGGSPLFAYSYRSPRGSDWHPTGHTLWVADRDSPASSRLSVISVSDGARRRAALSTVIALPRGTLVSSIAFYRGGSSAALRDNLLVASDEGRELLRIQLDPKNSTQITSTERWMQDVIGGIRVVAVGPDGTIYLGTANALGRLVPSVSPSGSSRR